MTEEIEQKEVLDLRITTTEIKGPSLSEEDFITKYNSGIEIIGFDGAVEVDASFLDEVYIPETDEVIEKPKFDSTPIVTETEVFNEETEELETVTETKIPEVPYGCIVNDEGYLELTNKSRFAYRLSLDGTKAIVLLAPKVGKTSTNHFKMTHERLVEMVELFGLENIITKSEYHKILESDNYRDNSLEM